jgi:prepilin-type N-terminal cleavage/methylation domain-containing protein
MSINTRKGFTLIEIIVALMIFSIVAVVALAALVKIVDANRKAQTTQDAVIGLSFALDAMSREMRTATHIYCGYNVGGFPASFSVTSYTDTACPSSANYIVFKSAVLDTVSATPCNLYYAYAISGSNGGPYQLQKAHQSAGSNCSQPLTSDMFYPITPTTVTLSGYNLSMPSWAGPDFPLVLIQLSGYAGTRERVKTYFNVQTAVSQRNK